MNFRPLENRILVKPDEAPSTTPGGLVIPEAHRKPTGFGTVVALGPGLLMNDGTRWPMPDIKVGDRIIYDARNPFPPVTLDGEKYLQLRDDTILGVVEQ